MMNAIFDFYPAQIKAIGFVSIPHSGEWIPEEFRPFLSGDEKAYGKDVDFKTRDLIDIKKLNENGIHVIVSNVHRICIDLNRDEDKCVFAWEKNSHGEKLVEKMPSSDEIKKFKDKYYGPYYEVLKTTIKNLNGKENKKANVIDFHSMPSHPTAYHLAITPNQHRTRPDFCLSNLKGISSSENFINDFKEMLEKEYDNINLNFPYYGGHLTQYINTLNTENFQVEVRRNLYMDEKKRELIESHLKVKKLASDAIIELFQKYSN